MAVIQARQARASATAWAASMRALLPRLSAPPEDEYVKRFSDPLQAVSFTPVILPVSDDINDDFGGEEETTLTARLYLLYRDTDVDVLSRHGDSRLNALGLDLPAISSPTSSPTAS